MLYNVFVCMYVSVYMVLVYISMYNVLIVPVYILIIYAVHLIYMYLSIYCTAGTIRKAQSKSR